MIGPEQILNALKNWKIEMTSPYNDGWVQQGYKENLQKIEDFFEPKYLDKALESLKEPDAVAVYEDEIELYETYGGD
jgi:hypothetical protein